MLQLWLYDGTPILAKSVFEIPEKSTTIQPPDGLYEPRTYNPETQEWEGSVEVKEDVALEDYPEQPQA